MINPILSLINKDKINNKKNPLLSVIKKSKEEKKSEINKDPIPIPIEPKKNKENDNSIKNTNDNSNINTSKNIENTTTSNNNNLATEKPVAIPQPQHESLYIGKIANNGKRNGFGKLVLPDESQYEGNFKDNEFDGYGVYKCKSYKYEGNFLQGKKSGKGKLEDLIKNSVYEGEFSEDKKNGVRGI